MARANVDVKAIHVADGDLSDNAAFVRNMTNANYQIPGNSVRDIPSNADFWVVQVFAAYEHDLAVDFDQADLG